MEELKILKSSIYTKQLINLSKKGLISMLIILITMFMISKPIIKILLTYYNITVTSINITESIDIQIAFTLIMTLLLSIPMILNIITYFIEIKNNKITRTIWYSFMLSIIGLILGLTIMTKQMLIGLSTESIVVGAYSIKNILTFGMSIGFVTALSLQLILLIPLLSELKLINIKKYNPIILIVTTYFLCAWITPSDLTSTFITMIPMNISTFLGIKLSKPIRENKKTCEEKIK